ncbi:trypsin-like peptidase domain-containing protein [Tabrizicola sp.]|uniref:trypsin-like peptidase domain-containing protein n=1 Tax=Tabrizicola sp. TaxID=2005166 RepID=UPI003D292E9E
MQKIAMPSVQSLLLEMRYNGQPLSTGTGFVSPSANGPLLITNRHNVTGRRQDNGKPISATGGVPNEVVVHQNCKARLGSWQKKIEPLYLDPEDEERRWVEHPVLGSKADFVALPLTQLDGVELYPHDPAKPGENMLIGPADSVSVIGFPFGLSAGGLFPVWATGFIASEPIVDFDGLPIQLIDCRSRQGQSGSPVLAYRSGGMVAMADGSVAAYTGPVSRLIGIYSGRVNAESDIGIVWKTSAILELVDSIKS